jgi:Cupin domain
VLEIEGGVPPRGEGPPMHIHVNQVEEGVVLSGVLAARVGARTITVGPGEPAVFPRGVPHRWWNAGDEPLVSKGRAVPAGDLDRQLQAVFAVVNAGANGRPSLFHLAHVQYRHRHTQRLALAPAWVQTIVLFAIVALGRLVGAYPAAGWPGAPQSCPGAPEAPLVSGEGTSPRQHTAVSLA